MTMGALYEAFAAADDRLNMSRRLRCKPETIEALEDAVFALSKVESRIQATKRERLCKRAEELGWVACDIHSKHTKRPRIDCYSCQRANTADVPLYPSDDLPGQGI